MMFGTDCMMHLPNALRQLVDDGLGNGEILAGMLSRQKTARCSNQQNLLDPCGKGPFDAASCITRQDWPTAALLGKLPFTP